MAKVTYHKSHAFVDKSGNKHTFVTQLYKTGVYGILDNNPQMQGSFSPQQIKNMEENLEKRKKDGEIQSFELGIPITVTNSSGLWEEISN